MKKLIAIVIVALAIVGGAYWLSGMVKQPSVTPPVTTPGNTGGENPTTSGPTSVAKGPFIVITGTSGPYLADKSGLTLYTNLADTSVGKITPTCNAACEKNWIPYLLGDTQAAPDKSSDSLLSRVNLFKRADGKMQFALGTQALYRYVGDKALGDTTGASISGWAVARP